LKLIGKDQFPVHAGDINVPGGSIHDIKKHKEAIEIAVRRLV
jgi:hypothetical protein